MNVYIDNQKIDVQLEEKDSLDTVIKTDRRYNRLDNKLCKKDGR